MDPISDIVQGLHLSGGLFLDAQFGAPWCVVARVGPEDCHPFSATPRHLIAYHYVTEGQLQLQLAGQAPVSLSRGHLVLLPHNDEHRLGSDLTLPAVGVDGLIRPAGEGQSLPSIRYGGEGPRARILCGFLGCDGPGDPLLPLLPGALLLRVADAATGDWIESSLQFAARQLASGRLESPAMLARLAELLFIEAINGWLRAQPTTSQGWLAGLRDPVVGRALGLLHGRPGQRWTTTLLAREAGLSRSAFAERFRTLLGEPPMTYLARWRMQGAARQLAESALPLSRIALEAGYDSEAAFNRAFKRVFGLPPATWRRRQQSEDPAP
ncbi:AraC family transcriptional regulator [Zobellella denitrificans]|uniref:AraC family transcriptional regulator n=1 Tax=Zobellella denitrificans TaxID=347534 RepID=UPI000B8C39D7|nr:AraC family transcriptional regulator [Zobellella denitrificans]OXS16816.1 AraC family transcriptional regulator [Zobellella denitrificans]